MNIFKVFDCGSVSNFVEICSLHRRLLSLHSIQYSMNNYMGMNIGKLQFIVLVDFG